MTEHRRVPEQVTDTGADLGDVRLRTALAYAARDWLLLPVGEHKRPLGGIGLASATADAEAIRGWFQRWPNCRVAMACKPSGKVVIDLDRNHADGIDGIATFETIAGCEPHGAALVAATPKGGRHLIYAAPARVEIRSRNAAAPGVDVKAGGGEHGGYVVLPDGTGRDGREWIEGDPLEDEITELPKWLHDWLTETVGAVDAGCGGAAKVAPRRLRMTSSILAGAATDHAIAEVESALSAIPSDIGRTEWLAAIFGAHAALLGDPRGAALVERWSATSSAPGQWQPGEGARVYQKAHDPESATDIDRGTLFELANRHGWTGLSTELPAPFAGGSVATTEAIGIEPASAPEPNNAFPIELVSGADLFSRAVRHITQTAVIPQPAYACAAALALFGALLGRRVQTSTRTRTNVYCMGVGDTATGKDQPRKLAASWLATVAPDVEQTREFASGSGVYSILRSSPSAFATIDEFGHVLAAATGTRAAAHQRSIATAALTLFSAADATVAGAAYADRVLNKPEPIVEPCLTIMGFATPSTLAEALSSGNVADGLLGRFLVFVGDDRAQPRPDRFRSDARAPDDDAGLIDELRTLRAAVQVGDLPDLPGGAARCRTIPFSDGAADLLGGELTALQQHRRQADPTLAAVWARYVEHVAKVSLIYSVVNDPATTHIGEASVRWAARLVEYSILSMVGFLRDRLADNDVERASKKLLRVINEAGADGITRQRLCRATQWLGRRERNDMIESLTDAGLIRVSESPSTRTDGKGRKATTFFAAGWGGA